MERTEDAATALREQIVKAERELQALRVQLSRFEKDADARQNSGNGPSVEVSEWKWPLQAEEYERYARQIVLPGFGVRGQQRLKSSRVLIVGAGGLGCPAATYLAGAGIGTVGVVDGDRVETSNLHRQIGHATSRVGEYKVDSLVEHMEGINPLPKYVAHRTHLTPQNAEDIVSQYDIVLDCTDHPTSRYLISDICVLLSKPLVSASALRTDGQLIVLNYPPVRQKSSAEVGGPCYRCIYPVPPAPESVKSCGEGGILGPVVGVMGVLQALEAIKVLVLGFERHPPVLDTFDPVESREVPAPTLMLFSSPLDGISSFKSIRMRGRRRDCFACGVDSTLTLSTLCSGSLDYMAFCGGSAAPIKLLAPEARISAKSFAEMIGQSARRPHLLDVRERELFDAGHLEGAINIPFSSIQTAPTTSDDKSTLAFAWLPADFRDGYDPLYVVCRVGNDSQVVAKQLQALDVNFNKRREIKDIEGGMQAWKKDVDPSIPFI